MLYPIAAEALVRPAPDEAAGRASGDCASPALLARLASLSPGAVMAPIDAGAWIVAATPQRVVAAPYHRNGAGDLDAYRFYLGSPAAAARIAARWRVRYLVVCGAMPGTGERGTAAARLTRTSLPGWRPLAHFPDGARLDTRDGASARGKKQLARARLR